LTVAKQSNNSRSVAIVADVGNGSNQSIPVVRSLASDESKQDKPRTEQYFKNSGGSCQCRWEHQSFITSSQLWQATEAVRQDKAVKSRTAAVSKEGRVLRHFFGGMAKQ